MTSLGDDVTKLNKYINGPMTSLEALGDNDVTKSIKYKRPIPGSPG